MRALAIGAIALAFGFFGSTPLAGPISVMVVSRAAHGKFEDARRIAIGAAIAEALYAGVAFWGFATFLSRHPLIVPLSHGMTAVLLVMLGVHFVFFVPKDKDNGVENKTGSLLLGFSISALNPTLLVTWSAAVAFLYSKGLRETHWTYAIPFGLSAGAGIALWFSLLTMLLRKYEGMLPRALLTGIVRVLGVALVGLGVWSGVQLAQWLHRDASKSASVVMVVCERSADL